MHAQDSAISLYQGLAQGVCVCLTCLRLLLLILASAQIQRRRQLLTDLIHLPALSLSTGKLPELDTGAVTYGVLGGATALKLIAYLICVALQSKSDSMLVRGADSCIFLCASSSVHLENALVTCGVI